MKYDILFGLIVFVIILIALILYGKLVEHEIANSIPVMQEEKEATSTKVYELVKMAENDHLIVYELIEHITRDMPSYYNKVRRVDLITYYKYGLKLESKERR